MSTCQARCGPGVHGVSSPVSGLLRRSAKQIPPRSVACLGAGVLSDIPYRRLIECGGAVHLVDWLPGVCQSGIKHSIIEIGDDNPACAAFTHGECPTIHHEDVTGDYASHFSRRLLAELRGVGS